MPVLNNPRHELFAQYLAQDKTQDEAYKLAGYKPSRLTLLTVRSRQKASCLVSGSNAKRLASRANSMRCRTTN